MVLLSGSTEDASRIASAHPEISFERTPAPSEKGIETWYLTARIETRHRAEEFARRMREIETVRAAYVKPDGEPPR
ncbi:hypothetical protein QOZ88_22895 [Blastococcus sp. BMG 814]|uniref:Uncharacterized protein n=1 Tax=Blastococcus carthaginiensis TaxID=3050034 RepID=A0ABT9IIT2_9ACTN|nr:hypothetical protein [Blastococcus carthaginiensis]MDP5185492.1 hypothetical protein [Blastococcus carthaginiensis]